MKVCDMVFQDRCLVVLTTLSTIHVFSIASSCACRISHSRVVDFDDSHTVLLPLESVRRITLPASSSIPIRVVPLTKALEVPTSDTSEDSLEAFGCEKDEEEEDPSFPELWRVVLLNHDHTADLLSGDGAERKQLRNDVLSVFLVNGSSATPLALRTSLLLFGQHRYNVFSPLDFSPRPGFQHWTPHQPCSAVGSDRSNSSSPFSPSV